MTLPVVHQVQKCSLTGRTGWSLDRLSRDQPDRPIFWVMTINNHGMLRLLAWYDQSGRAHNSKLFESLFTRILLFQLDLLMFVFEIPTRVDVLAIRHSYFLPDRLQVDAMVTLIIVDLRNFYSIVLWRRSWKYRVDEFVSICQTKEHWIAASQSPPWTIWKNGTGMFKLLQLSTDSDTGTLVRGVPVSIWIICSNAHASDRLSMFSVSTSFCRQRIFNSVHSMHYRCWTHPNGHLFLIVSLWNFFPCKGAQPESWYQKEVE